MKIPIQTLINAIVAEVGTEAVLDVIGKVPEQDARGEKAPPFTPDVPTEDVDPLDDFVDEPATKADTESELDLDLDDDLGGGGKDYSEEAARGIAVTLAKQDRAKLVAAFKAVGVSKLSELDDASRKAFIDNNG